MPPWIFGMLGSRFWYNSNSHNVCHGLWGYSDGHPLVNCRIPDSLTCKSSSASPIATAWWGTKLLFQLQWQPPPTRLMFFWQTREHKEPTSLQMDVLIYHFYGGILSKWPSVWCNLFTWPLNHAVGYRPTPRWSFGVLVYVILVGQFPIGQSKQTKSELTRNIIKVDKEPEKKQKKTFRPTNPNPTEDKKCRRVLVLRQGKTNVYHGNIWVPGFVDVMWIVQIDFLLHVWQNVNPGMDDLLSLHSVNDGLNFVHHLNEVGNICWVLSEITSHFLVYH